MLLDEDLRQASDAESSLAEDSFGNGQDTVLLDQVREFQHDQAVSEADRQIYADQGFNYIPPQERTTPRVTPSKQQQDDVLKRAREINQKKKAQEEKRSKLKQAGKNLLNQKKGQTQTTTTAQPSTEKAKKRKTQKGEIEGDNSENASQSLAEKYKPDTQRLVHDATHGDPRQVVGDLADQYLHAGRRVGDILFLIWIVLTIATSITIIGGILSLFMLNLLLIAPNWNYRITRWILEFILDFFGVGEVLTVAAQFGATKIDVKISGLEKGAIIAFDILVFIILILLAALSLTLTCATTGRAVGYAAPILDWWYSTGGVLTQIQAVCTQVNQATGL